MPNTLFLKAEVYKTEDGRNIVRIHYDNGRISELGKMARLDEQTALNIAAEYNAAMQRRRLRYVSVNAIAAPLDVIANENSETNHGIRRETVICHHSLDLYHHASALVNSNYADGNARASLASVIKEINQCVKGSHLPIANDMPAPDNTAFAYESLRMRYDLEMANRNTAWAEIRRLADALGIDLDNPKYATAADVINDAIATFVQMNEAVSAATVAGNREESPA